MSGGVENVTVLDSIFKNPSGSGAIRVKSAKGRGGYVKNIVFDNITVVNWQGGSIIAFSDNYGENNP